MSNQISFDLTGIDKVEAQGGEPSGFLNKPYVGPATVKGYEASQTKGGTPYIEVEFLTDSGQIVNGTFWLPKEGDEQKKKDWKLGRIKGFLINCGVNVSLPQDKLFDAACGKKLLIAVQIEAYIGTDDRGCPEIKRKAGLRFDSPLNKPFGEYVNDEYLTKDLSPDDWAKYRAMKAAWEKQNPGAVASSAGSAPAPAAGPMAVVSDGAANVALEDDDLPF